ncbi:MAG: PilZ domain-containing protein, partial [Terriglobia bacterium]
MKCTSNPPFLVHCSLSRDELARACEGALFEVSSHGTRCRTPDTLIEGDYLTLRLALPDEPQPLSIKLATVTWVRENRFGVELLVMDNEVRQRLGCFLDTHFPLQMEFADTRTELTISATQ